MLIADILGDGDPLESDKDPETRTLRLRPVERFARVAREQHLREIAGEMPAPGEYLHVVSAAKFDFWTWIPQAIAWIGRTETLYCSTWTVSRPNVIDLVRLWDAGGIGTVAFLTGLYFKRRETAVYATLLQAIQARGGRYRASRNHAKVILLDNPARDAWITIEGSANLTSNPRTEQSLIANSRPLWEFHRGWMEETFKR